MIERSNAFGDARKQFDLFRPAQKSDIAIQDAVAVEKDRPSRIFVIEASDFSRLPIVGHLLEPLWRAHVLDVLTGHIAKERQAIDEFRKHMPAQVARRRERKMFKHTR